MEKESSECSPEMMDSEDHIFLLYTSGSTGKPMRPMLGMQVSA